MPPIYVLSLNFCGGYILLLKMPLTAAHINTNNDFASLDSLFSRQYLLFQDVLLFLSRAALYP